MAFSGIETATSQLPEPTTLQRHPPAIEYEEAARFLSFPLALSPARKRKPLFSAVTRVSQFNRRARIMERYNFQFIRQAGNN
jgi:hypothetical protein